MRIVLLTWLACGCSAKLVDPCSGVSGTCVALYVDSSPQPIDTLEVGVTGAGSPKSQPSKSPNGNPFSPPIAVALLFDDSLIDPSPLQLTFNLIGERDQAYVAGATTTAQVTRGVHTAVHVALTSAIPDLGTADWLASDLSASDLSTVDLSLVDLSGSDLSAANLADLANEPATARLIAPLSTSTVTQQQPTLRWVLGPGMGTPVVDLCKDRSCNTALVGVTAVVAGSHLSAVPSVALPQGWVYWRVRVLNGGQSTTSATWQFWVGKAVGSTTVDSSSGTVLDVNGDGYADFLIGEYGVNSQAGAAHLYLGNADGTGFQRIDLNGPDGTGSDYGAAVAGAGDVNGDGYADFLVGGFDAEAAHLYLGGPSPSAINWNGATAPQRIDLTNPDGTGALFGYSVAGAGDVNGDGYADFLIGAEAASSSTGAAHLYLGEANPSAGDWNTASPKRIDSAGPDGTNSTFGNSVAGAGDVNGDGYADFLVGAPVTGSMGAAHLYLGEATPAAADWNVGTPPPKRVDLTCPDGTNAQFGSVGSAGDVNGDGYADFLVGASGAGSNVGAAHLYLGEATPAAADWNAPSPPPKRIDLTSASPQFGFSVTSAGDVNGDGYADFLIGSMSATAGAANLYLGEPTPAAADWNTGSPPPKRFDLTGPDGTNSGFGRSVAGAGDVNGDGYADFLVGAYRTSTNAGAAHLYLGESTPALADWNTGSPPPKRLDLSSPDSGNAFFGASVASAHHFRLRPDGASSYAARLHLSVRM